MEGDELTQDVAKKSIITDSRVVKSSKRSPTATLIKTLTDIPESPHKEGEDELSTGQDQEHLHVFIDTNYKQDTSSDKTLNEEQERLLRQTQPVAESQNVDRNQESPEIQVTSEYAAVGPESNSSKMSDFDEGALHGNDVNGSEGCVLGSKKGPHIVVFTLLCMPVALITSFCVSFYFGAWTWYNIYVYYSEERTMCHKVTVCPVLILTFPFSIGFTSLSLGIFAAFVQISWNFTSWIKEFKDFEKGFYDWFCYKVGLSQCCPYEVLNINDDSELEPMRTEV